MKTMIGLNEKKYWDHADLVIYLNDAELPEAALLERYGMFFSNVIIASPQERHDGCPTAIHWYSYPEDQVKSETWNKLLKEASSEWMLFIEQDEEIRLDQAPDLTSLNNDLWPAVLLLRQKEDKHLQYYHTRMVHTGWNGTEVFSGLNLPDCTRFVVENNITFSAVPLVIECNKDPYSQVDIEEELSVINFSPKLYLVEGNRQFSNRKYALAAAQFRQILKQERLIPYDRLAAVNGLASCLAEQYKWDKAVSLAEKSIQAEPFQGVPYLIIFKIAQLNKQWKAASEALTKYYEYSYYEKMNLYSRASFDITLGVDEVLVTLSEMALKAGDTELCSDYLEELFSVKNGELDNKFVHKLLMLSIEHMDYQKSVFFFQKLYGDHIPLTINDEQRSELNDYMDMFMKKGWYGFVKEVYENLHHAFPEDDEYRRRLIVSLLKTDNVEKARVLATKVA